MIGNFGFVTRSNVVFVTDRGSNIVAALRHDVRLNCAAHLVNNVLETMFKESTLQTSPPLLHVQLLLHSCRDLVGYFKRSAIMEKLDTALDQCVATRWNSHLAMLVSVDRNFDKICEVSFSL